MSERKDRRGSAGRRQAAGGGVEERVTTKNVEPRRAWRPRGARADGPDQRPRHDLNDLTGYGFVDKRRKRTAPAPLPSASRPRPGGARHGRRTGAAQAAARRRRTTCGPPTERSTICAGAVPARRARKRQAVVGSGRGRSAGGYRRPGVRPCRQHRGQRGRATPSSPATASEAPGRCGRRRTRRRRRAGQGPPFRQGVRRARTTPASKDTPKDDPERSRRAANRAAVQARAATLARPVARAQLSVIGERRASPTPAARCTAASASSTLQQQCAVSGAGTFDVQALGAADPAKITVVEHAAGDPAAGLPDPSQESTRLVLHAAAAYEVKFAWVPSDTCPTTARLARPEPDGRPAASGGTASGPGAGTGPVRHRSGAETQLRSDGGTADGRSRCPTSPEPGGRSRRRPSPTRARGRSTRRAAGRVVRRDVGSPQREPLNVRRDEGAEDPAPRAG